MIKLSKGPKPEILEQNASGWLNIILDKEKDGKIPSEYDLSKYTHKDIKEALILETHGKCAYCESKFLHVTYGDVEHIVPKKLGHHHRFEWNNLTIACDVCNTGKGSKENIVDPYEDNIDEMFSFFGAFVFSKPGSDKAILTEKSLKLNRPKLIEERGERLARIGDLVRLAIGMKNQQDREILLADIFDNEISDKTEFSATSKSFYNHLISENVIPNPS